MKIIEVDALTKQFGERIAVNQATFSVQQGDVFGLLGPNGAGKTTLVRLLNGVLAPTSGKAQVFGLDPSKQGETIRQRTGVLTETPALYERLTAYDNLRFFGDMYNVPEAGLSARVDELLKLFDLADRAQDKAGGYSKGMKQRLALARALIHNPELLFFDEPTSGLDPEASKQVDDLLHHLSHESGRTIVLCTHNLEQAQRLCTRVGIINKGRLLAIGTPEELAKQLWQGLRLDVRLYAPFDAAPVVSGLRGVSAVQQDALTLSCQVADEAVIPLVVAALVGAGAQVVGVQPHQYTLTDIYFRVQGEQ